MTEALQHERKYRLWWCNHRHNLKGPREQLIERATEGANQHPWDSAAES